VVTRLAVLAVALSLGALVVAEVLARRMALAGGMRRERFGGL
jgi:molybdate transport system permease protein